SCAAAAPSARSTLSLHDALPILRVIMPMIRENVSTAAVYMGIVALDMFVYVQVMAPNGGTAKSAEVISRYLYQTAFFDSRFGLASAMGVVLALVTMLMAVIVLFGLRRKDETP